MNFPLAIFQLNIHPKQFPVYLYVNKWFGLWLAAGGVRFSFFPIPFLGCLPSIVHADADHLVCTLFLYLIVEISFNLFTFAW
jgi:hypothetical protein